MASVFDTCAGCGLPFDNCACPPKIGSVFDRYLGQYLNVWTAAGPEDIPFGFLKEGQRPDHEPWQLLANRRTGRTTRMVEIAMHEARRGARVTILVLDKRHEQLLRRHYRLPEEVHVLTAASWEFKKDCRDLESWLRPKQGHMRLADPAVIETLCGPLLRELHRYDAPYPDWAHTMQQREREKRPPFDNIRVSCDYRS